MFFLFDMEDEKESVYFIYLCINSCSKDEENINCKTPWTMEELLFGTIFIIKRKKSLQAHSVVGI